MEDDTKIKEWSALEEGVKHAQMATMHFQNPISIEHITETCKADQTLTFGYVLELELPHEADCSADACKFKVIEVVAC